MKKSIGMKLFFGITIFTLVIVAIVWFLNSRFLGPFYLEKKKESFINQKNYIQSIYTGDPEAIDDELEKIESSTGGNITILSKEGKLKYGTSLNRQGMKMGKGNMGNFSIYSEITKVDINKVLNGQTLLKIYEHPRFSINILVLMTQVTEGDILILEASVEAIEEGIEITQDFYIYIGFISLGIGTLLAFIFSKVITKPIVDLNRVASKMGTLDFSDKYEVRSKDEIGKLGETMNYLSDRLADTIEELNEANRQLKRDIERERELEKMRKEFVASVSHELKTPISLIQGYAEGLKDNIAGDLESRSFYSEVIIDESERMAKLVEDLLDLSQLDSGYLKLERRNFNIVTLIEKTVDKFAPVLKERRIHTAIREDLTNPEVNGDPRKMEQVIVNFINNAINHIEEQGKLVITVTRKDGKTRVGIYNSGSHIPDREKDKIWHRFYKLDKARTRKYGGTGLGLSIVKGILELHNSSFGVEDKENGVEFWFEL